MNVKGTFLALVGLNLLSDTQWVNHDEMDWHFSTSSAAVIKLLMRSDRREIVAAYFFSDEEPDTGSGSDNNEVADVR